MKAVVIGAGVAGLATAAYLGYEGYEVTVVEKNDAIGGRAGSLAVDGFRWDTGPSWYLMPDAFDHFFEFFGSSTAERFKLETLDPAYRLFPEGMQPLDVSGTKAVELFESIEPGAGKALEEYLQSAAETYQVAVDHFLYTTFTRLPLHRDVTTRLWLLLKLLSSNLESFVNARFKDHRLRQMLTYPAVFLSSAPRKTPAMYHLMSHTDLTQGVMYPEGGFAAVIDAIADVAREQGASIRLGAEVAQILSKDGKAVGVELVDATVLDADVVVSAADLKHTEQALLPKDLRTYPESYFAKRNPGIGTVLLYLGVEGELPELLHHNLLFSRDWDPDFEAVFNEPAGTSRSLYISKPSATDSEVAPEGYENLFVLVPVRADEHFNREEQVADAAIEQIAQWTGIEDLAQRIVQRHIVGPKHFAEQYYAWSGGSVGPAHTLKQSALLRGSNASKKVDGLYYAGATTVPGVGVPMCLISAENVLKRLRGDTSHQALER
ncbi:phytoene desaturase family protein [Corynebacterium pseudopelargi]|uniref:Zeta-carotene-forming phytoene desaturase n=1 Tax=Corynebacterium pseudopelargi TaxID=2080757 RepID=A0A3G6IS82_9CORY|nr:phytoene desaturase family protein [Corynebacterium pseudopelargi]AZA08327.1 zeta-carotene-forming phytoene desaturase [Corynebacterium pseudopelargi]